MRLAHRVKELDELPHNLHAMPSINKVKNWYAQSFEVSHLLVWLAPSRPLIYYRQELITFPPIVLPPKYQALMVSRPDDIALPESKPNPNDRYTDHSNGGSPNGNNGFNKLRFRVPLERRYVYPPYLYLASPILSF